MHLPFSPKRHSTSAVIALVLALLLSINPLFAQSNNADSAKIAKKLTKLKRINNIIVVYQENWSFESLYGLFPGANVLHDFFHNNPLPQVDAAGNPLISVPQPINNGAPDPRFNGVTLPTGPYNLATYVPPDALTGDIVHRFYHEQYQIYGNSVDPGVQTAPGTNQHFVVGSDNGGLVMSYFDATNL